MACDLYCRLLPRCEFLRTCHSGFPVATIDTAMGANWWGTRGTCPPTFSRGGNIICHVPPLFLFRFCIWRGFKNKSDVCHFLCEQLFMLDGRPHNQVDVETVLCGITDSVSLQILASTQQFLAFFKFLEAVNRAGLRGGNGGNCSGPPAVRAPP